MIVLSRRKRNLCNPDLRNVEKRINEFRELKEGWLDEGYGQPFKKNHLDWLYTFVKSLLLSRIPEPLLYPSDEDRISVEWHNKNTYEVLLKVSLPQKEAKLFVYDRSISKICLEDFFVLSVSEDRLRLITVLSRFIPTVIQNELESVESLD